MVMITHDRWRFLLNYIKCLIKIYPIFRQVQKQKSLSLWIIENGTPCTIWRVIYKLELVDNNISFVNK